MDSSDVYYQYEGQNIEEHLFGDGDTLIRKSNFGNHNVNTQYEYGISNDFSIGVSASPLWLGLAQFYKGNLLGYIRYSKNIIGSYSLQEVAGISVGFKPYFGFHINKSWNNTSALAMGIEYYSGTNLIWAPSAEKGELSKKYPFPSGYYSYEHYYREFRFPLSVQWNAMMITFSFIKAISDRMETNFWTNEENDDYYGLNTVRIDRKFELKIQGSFLCGKNGNSIKDIFKKLSWLTNV